VLAKFLYKNYYIFKFRLIITLFAIIISSRPYKYRLFVIVFIFTPNIIIILIITAYFLLYSSLTYSIRLFITISNSVTPSYYSFIHHRNFYINSSPSSIILFIRRVPYIYIDISLFIYLFYFYLFI